MLLNYYFKIYPFWDIGFVFTCYLYTYSDSDPNRHNLLAYIFLKFGSHYWTLIPGPNDKISILKNAFKKSYN